MSSAVVEDPWQARLDRIRRIVPLPLLAGSTVAAFAVPSSWIHPGIRFELGIPFVAASAVIWGVVTVHPLARSASTTRWSTVFAAHTVLSGVLVGLNPAYGVFAYVGFLFAYGLGPRVRTAGFAITALVVAASLSDGYPSGGVGQIVLYLVVAVVLMALVLNSATITVRMMEQNRDRGQMIEELAQAYRRLEVSTAENAELHARLVGQAREAGIVEERRRLAGEIHDTLAQGLTGIIAQLQAAEQTRHRPEEWSRHVGQAGALARSSLTQARRSVQALRPEQLVDATLVDAVRGLAAEWSAQSGVRADVDVVGGVARGGVNPEAAVFRAAQEALSNVAKHAGATVVRLTLTYLGETVLLDVVDDGHGFDPTGRPDGYGLIGMRQRLGRVGGTLTVDSAPGAGTTLNAVVPLLGPEGEATS